MPSQFRVVISILVVCFLSTNSVAFSNSSQTASPLTITDVMQFESFTNESFSDNGRWIAYSVAPNRGDARGIIQSTDGKQKIDIERATKPQFNATSTHVAFIIEQPWLEKELSKNDKKKSSSKKNKVFELLLVNLSTQQQSRYQAVKSFEFSEKSPFIAIHFANNEAGIDDAGSEEADSDEKSSVESTEKNEQIILSTEEVSDKKSSKKTGSNLLLLDLSSGKKIEIASVSQFAFAFESAQVAYATASENGEANGVKLQNLDDLQNTTAHTIFSREQSVIAQLKWHEHSNNLAFYVADGELKINQRLFQLWVWRGQANNPRQGRLQQVKFQPKNFMINQYSEIHWSEQDESLTYGVVPVESLASNAVQERLSESDLYDTQKILQQASLQLWHFKDLQIKSEAQATFKDSKKQQTLIQYQLAGKKNRLLASESEFKIIQKDNQHAMLLLDEKPYQIAQSWQGTYFDAYYLSRTTGKRLIVDRKLRFSSSIKISPDGRYVSYFKDKHIWFFDTRNNKRYNLSEQMSVAFFEEDDDRPGPDNAYGFAGWMDNSRQFLVYDKYDIWMWDVVTQKAKNLTEEIGRVKDRQLRIIDMHEKSKPINANSPYWLTSFNMLTKQYGFFSLRLKQASSRKLASSEIKKLVEGEHRYRWLGKSEDADAIFYTRENFSEFPNLWKTDRGFTQTKQISQLNTDILKFAWGKPELVDWLNADGVKHQGILIKPANYQVGKSYPTLVYFYEIYSDRLFQFNDMKINHRPNLAYYASNGYAVFLPDIHFKIGAPGDSAVKALVPGVQKLIAMGVTDAKAVGIHGHSWGGYQTAFAITQTDLFAAAVAGAPVANMTSAYSGIRLGSGKPRQFQYESGQSRIAHSMWQRRDLYIENSPVFFADRINTPLLIEFGDKDDAVPWEQGIELYLAMRRLNKPAVLLQYEGEPHHLKKFANQLDYTLKVKAFFDHYLKQQVAPEWLVNGEAYRAKD